MLSCREGDIGHFLNDLILSELKDDHLERTSTIFFTQNDMTALQLGSLTAASPHLNPLEAHTWSGSLAARNQAKRDKWHKSIVAFRKTSKRDIQPHVARILHDSGL